METRDDAQPVAEYGLLADCNSAALVDRGGSIDWLCLPRYDSDAVFARLLDPDAGHWSIAPTGSYSSERRYLPGTLVLETTFATETGKVTLTDAMAFVDGQRGHDVGLDAPHELLRSVKGLSGEVELRMELAPRPEYGLVKPLMRLDDAGARTFGGSGRVALRSSVALTMADSTIGAAFTVAAGEVAGFALRWAPPELRDPPPPTSPNDVGERVEETVEAWRSWEREHDIYEGPHKELVRQSSRVLKGLTYRPTGAIVAAPTTSLPETVGGERNWDYRFAWIRDSSMTIEALYIGACPEEVEEFVSFMTSSAGGRAGAGSLQIMYGVGGEHDLSERELGHLRGWRGSRPGTRRERGLEAGAARRLRRAAEFALRLSGEARCAASGDSGVRSGPGRHRGTPLARARFRNLGDAGSPAPPPLLEGPVLGRARSRGQARAAARRLREGGPMGGGA
jgi:alpha,alpha-trehalase